jgi:cyclopropane-fatty-acyl-phospholipid synthase
MNRYQSSPLGLSGKESGQERPSTSRPTKLDHWLVDQLSRRFDTTRVRFELWDSSTASGTEGTPAILRFSDCGALVQLLTHPELNFGDLYGAGRIAVDGDLRVVLDEAYRHANQNPRRSRVLARLRSSTPDLSDSRRNIHHHCDIGNEFYRLWLDREALQYTCAYYADAAMSLEQAQQAKMHHVCRKLRLRAGERVVEASGGWGGFALFMARNYGVQVRSFNISKQQISWSRDWAKAEGLDGQVEFIEDDYRNISGRYDAFVSVGMLEHVGPGNYRQLGALINRVLTPEGRGLVHSIGRDRPQPLNPWIALRIFPGAYPPTLREMMDIFEPNGLSVLDIENLRLHYARTLEHWLEDYEANVEAVMSMFDEAFVRVWRLYLAGSNRAFEHGKLQLYQVLFSRSGMNAIPRTRAHLYASGD